MTQEIGRPDMQRGYRIAGKMREIALGTNDHPADDPDLALATQIGHVEHDGEKWNLTNQGQATYAEIVPPSQPE